MFRLISQSLVRAVRRLRRPLACGAATLTALCAAGLALAPAASAHPASQAALPPPASALQQVTNFGPNPAGLLMYLYVPAHVRPHPAVVVALHYCGGSGPAFFAGTEFGSLADEYGSASSSSTRP